ncbi:hypothetical protein Tco_0751293 [Tanacetum coccineum]|uniref:Retrotransposon gag domain-containing protein n=1 Tax=Tanacetum coccineum TaxID=301880 RepID=A0ABQ4Z4F6_9ASTR
MVNTRTDAELVAAVQAAVDAMLPQIREQVREEYRTGAVTSGSNPPPVTIHTWLERFNKQKPRSFEKAVAPVDAENWISHMEKIFDVMDCNDAFKTRLAVYKFEGDALAWWKAYKQAKGGDAWVLTLTWAAFKELFFLQFSLEPRQRALKEGVAAGTAEEQAKNFRWGLHKSILDHVMCIQFTDVAQVADAARNLEIPSVTGDAYERSDRSDKRHKSGDRYHLYSQQGSHRGPRSELGKTTLRNNNRNSGADRDQRNRDTQESVVVLLVLASNVARLVIFSGTARRTPGASCLSCDKESQTLGVMSLPYSGSGPPILQLIDFPWYVVNLTYLGMDWFLPGKSMDPSDCFSKLGVFSEELPGIPPIRDVEFNIEAYSRSEAQSPSSLSPCTIELKRVERSSYRSCWERGELYAKFSNVEFGLSNGGFSGSTCFLAEGITMVSGVMVEAITKWPDRTYSKKVEMFVWNPKERERKELLKSLSTFGFSPILTLRSGSGGFLDLQ